MIVLTNSTLLGDPEVRAEISLADRIYCKLDAWSDDQLRRINRPAEQISHETIVAGIAALRREFRGFLAIQTMILSQAKRHDIERLAKILRLIGADEVQLNVPARPVPAEWNLSNRGNRVTGDLGSRAMKLIAPAQLLMLADVIEELTFLPVITPPSVSRPAAGLGHS
ncbi:MAG: hypothetical protein QUS14_04000 [Pyrinomonadaceae bacterium]|nr:hypothetical protein [Pyrinomonadaceae bacterium]